MKKWYKGLCRVHYEFATRENFWNSHMITLSTYKKNMAGTTFTLWGGVDYNLHVMTSSGTVQGQVHTWYSIASILYIQVYLGCSHPQTGTEATTDFIPAYLHLLGWCQNYVWASLVVNHSWLCTLHHMQQQCTMLKNNVLFCCSEYYKSQVIHTRPKRTHQEKKSA